MTMRCPVCFSRDIDVLMKLKDGQYHCLKCSFTGTEDEVRQQYANLKSKFKWIDKRITIEDYEEI